MQLLFNNAVFQYDPYPIGLVKPIFDEAGYAALVDIFPPNHLLPIFGSTRAQGYKKFALNERSHPVDFKAYLATQPLWSAFHHAIKSQKFINMIFSLLKAHGIKIAPAHSWSSRFEFSAMPSDGGKIDPHTDIDSKAVTLIFSMRKPNDIWNPTWGGGTDVLRPLDPMAKLESYRAPLDQFERVSTYPYEPNQCVIFVKNEVSWHSVGPMLGPPGYMRRTITLNIERDVHKLKSSMSAQTAYEVDNYLDTAPGEA